MKGESEERCRPQAGKVGERLLWEIWKGLGVVTVPARGSGQDGLLPPLCSHCFSNLVGCILEGREGWDTESTQERPKPLTRQKMERRGWGKPAKLISQRLSLG